jgi:hypothetical protein
MQMAYKYLNINQIIYKYEQSAVPPNLMRSLRSTIYPLAGCDPVICATIYLLLVRSNILIPNLL